MVVGFGTRAGRLTVPKVGEHVTARRLRIYWQPWGRDNFADRRRIGPMTFNASARSSLVDSEMPRLIECMGSRNWRIESS
jgi:hypothetical protein